MQPTAQLAEAPEPRIDRRPMTSLGRLMNVVQEPVFGCPACDQGGPMQVYVAAVRWPCGHTRNLPTGGAR